ncbi:MAG: hypothetical protein JWM14_264, partial [Chitinophagaceae bacterium]|nr:hypothetical protein [Chitinophagaceae bacterium]
AIEDIISCETIITIGYIDFLGKSAFYELLEVINTWFLDDKVYAPKERNIHVWLTLPTMEIVDITILASFMKAAPNLFVEAKDFRQCFLGFPNDKGATGFVHRPQFVGKEFLYKTGLAIDY